MKIRERLHTAKERSRYLYKLGRRYKNTLIFLCGFLFDAITIKRIDALTDILIQITYLIGLTILIIYQYKQHKEVWTPGKWTGKVWHFNVEALHFLYGGLLSAYTILYLKSTSGARALFFLLLLLFLLIINEMPQMRKYGYRLRLGLYAFCVSSFMIFFVPIVIGRMNTWIFILSLVLSTVAVWFVARSLASQDENPRKSQIRLFVPAGTLMIFIFILYQLHLIPPVPLSVQYQGVFHHILKNGDDFKLRYPKPPWYAFWRDDSRPFLARPEDNLYYFTRVFAPSRFKTEVKVRWETYVPSEKKFVTTDLIPLSIIGGRAKGFRGFSRKGNFEPGDFRVSTETKDGRTVGYIKFEVRKDDPQKDRVWIDIDM